MDVDVILLKLGKGNDGIIARKRAIEAGCPARSIDRRVASGFLVSMLPGVYRLAGHPDTYRARVRAAWEWGGAHVMLAGGTVLALFGLEGFDSAAIELYLATGKCCPGVRVRRLPPDGLPRRAIGGMTGTTIDRALLDACAHYPAALVGKAMDDALRRRLTTVERLRATIPADRRGISGSKVFARLVLGRDLNDQKVRSEMETRMLAILRRIKNQHFVPDYEVLGAKKYFLDFAFPKVLLGVECHSRRWHGPEHLKGDLARHRDLQSLGWTILYYTWDDIEFQPDAVQREIEEFLARAASLQPVVFNQPSDSQSRQTG